MRMNLLGKLEQRFWLKVLKSKTCWIWFGARNPQGYGHFDIKKKKLSSHRFAYELFKGNIPGGLVIDHLCRNKSCVNPDHLEAVSQKENVRRGNVSKINLQKTHCPKGHPYSGDNLYFHNGRRSCMICMKIIGTLWWDTNKDRVNKEKREKYELEKLCQI